MVAQVPKSQAPEGLKPGSMVQLTNGMQVGAGWGQTALSNGIQEVRWSL